MKVKLEIKIEDYSASSDEVREFVEDCLKYAADRGDFYISHAGCPDASKITVTELI
jgi:hypothetical protein